MALVLGASFFGGKGSNSRTGTGTERTVVWSRRTGCTCLGIVSNYKCFFGVFCVYLVLSLSWLGSKCGVTTLMDFCSDWLRICRLFLQSLCRVYLQSVTRRAAIDARGAIA
jgi:hypothetical protein